MCRCVIEFSHGVISDGRSFFDQHLKEYFASMEKVLLIVQYRDNTTGGPQLTPCLNTEHSMSLLLLFLLAGTHAASLPGKYSETTRKRVARVLAEFPVIDGFRR